jgi:hypothetical protein
MSYDVVREDQNAGIGTSSMPDRLSFVHWHLDRYDRLRSSTATRASVVLSAGAILSAGNIIVLSQVANAAGRVNLNRTALVALAALATTSAMLVILCLLRASAVLVTRRDSRSALRSKGPYPTSYVYNGTDTVRDFSSFDRFSDVLRSCTPEDALAWAEVELWVIIHQHRMRYVQLRRSVKLLAWAAATFLLFLTSVMITLAFAM